MLARWKIDSLSKNVSMLNVNCMKLGSDDPNQSSSTEKAMQGLREVLIEVREIVCVS